MDNIQNNKSNDVFMQPCNFCIHCLLSFFRQDAISIVCCACVQASSVQETCFVNNFIIQMCFSTASHNYGNQSLGQTGTIIRQEEFSYRKNPLVTFDSMKAVFPVNGKPLVSLKKTKTTKKITDNLPTSRRQLHLTTYSTSYL